MSYLPTPAASGSTLSGTKNQIRDNFTKIQTDFAVNHVGFDLTGEGKHKFIQLPETLQADIPDTAADEAALYSKVGTSPAEANLFFRAEDSAGSGGFEYQMTKAIEASTSEFATNASYTVSGRTINNAGWTFLPGGLIMQYGNFDPQLNQSLKVTFPIAFPTLCFNVQLTGESGSASTFRAYVSQGTVSTTGFNFIGSNNSNWDPVYFIAIGN